MLVTAASPLSKADSLNFGVRCVALRSSCENLVRNLVRNL